MRAHLHMSKKSSTFGHLPFGFPSLPPLSKQKFPRSYVRVLPDIRKRFTEKFAYVQFLLYLCIEN